MAYSSDFLGDISRPMRLVIIDDSPSSVAALRSLVEENLDECEAITFTNSAAALDFCLTADVDLVVVDYHMPPPDGLRFIEQHRALAARRDVPIMMVTSEEARDVRYMALQIGATDFLTKPVDNVEFIARTRNLLSLSRSRRALANRAEWLAEEVRKATGSIIRRERESILFLSRAAEHRDPETGDHLVRMATYSRLLAKSLGLDTERVELIYTAAPMHDIGKIGVSDAILLKEGPLSPDEKRAMQQHTTYGKAILDGSTSPLLQLAGDIAYCHHERWDGLGYPRGLAGTEIPLVGRIVALADVFDALVTKRPYKPAWPVDDALAYLRAQRGSHFDPDCVDAFLADWDAVQRVAAAS